MLEIKWKIKKRKGNWRPLLDFSISFKESEYLELRPHFIFNKEYLLHSPIYLGGADIEASGYCRLIETIYLDIDTYVTYPRALHLRESLHSVICPSICNYCSAYLEINPANDYSGYEKILKEMAIDLCKTWNQAIEEVIKLKEYESEETIITSDDSIFKQKVKKEKNINRKLVI